MKWELCAGTAAGFACHSRICDLCRMIEVLFRCHSFRNTMFNCGADAITWVAGLAEVLVANGVALSWRPVVSRDFPRLCPKMQCRARGGKRETTPKKADNWQETTNCHKGLHRRALVSLAHYPNWLTIWVTSKCKACM